MIMAKFPFTFRLIQGSGQAEYKAESEPYPWKVDVWNPCRVTFHPSGGLGAFLEVRDDGELAIEMGYTYLFGLADETPAPAPEPEPPPTPAPTPAPQPEPPPGPGPVPPIPPVPSASFPKSITVYGSPVAMPSIIFWGSATWGTTEVVWIVPMDWYLEAWSKGMPTLLDKMGHAWLTGNYDVEYHTRG